MVRHQVADCELLCHLTVDEGTEWPVLVKREVKTIKRREESRLNGRAIFGSNLQVSRRFLSNCIMR